MTKAQFDRICQRAVQIVRDNAPVDTGNLKFNAIQFYYKNKDTFTIYVDGEPPKKGIAPYMPFTNEKWISPRWQGKQNPNEGWWQRACEEIKAMLKNEFGGEQDDNT